jgi:hypothetical protein
MGKTTIGDLMTAGPAREATAEIELVPDAPEVSEEFGLRSRWQPEHERIEAAEFLIATRLQEHVRRRTARDMLALRKQNRERFTAMVRQRTAD